MRQGSAATGWRPRWSNEAAQSTSSPSSAPSGISVGMPRTVQIYDAAYVALAELLGIDLLTADARLASAPGIRCAVEVI